MAAASAAAETESPNWFNLEAGWGYESQTSPLFQVAPDSTVIYIGGLQRLSGAHLRTSAQGFAEIPLTDAVSMSLYGSGTIKHSPMTPDLDFSSFSLQPSLHLPFGKASIGLGLSYQRMNVAGMHFRDTSDLQADWTFIDGKNLWAVLADIGSYRHPGELSDLDAHTTSLVVKHQFATPVKGIEMLDVSLIAGNEINDHGFHELSHRSAMLHTALQWNAFGMQWNAGYARRRADFDGSAFPNDPTRRDRTGIFDLSAEWDFNARQSLRIELNEVRNTSSTRLYDNHYQQLSIMLRTLL